MRKPQGFTLKNEEFIRSKIRNIVKLEPSISEKDLRWNLYQLGVYCYREFNKVGLPVDVKQPGLTAPKMVWSKNHGKYVDERELVPALV